MLVNILDFTSCENIVIVKPYLVTPVSKSMQILGLPIRVSLAPAEFGVSGLLPPPPAWSCRLQCMAGWADLR